MRRAESIVVGAGIVVVVGFAAWVVAGIGRLVGIGW